MNGGADEDQVGAKFLHQIELAFRAVEGLGARRFRQPLEVAEGLEQHDLQPHVADHPADIGGRPVMGDEVLLEYLDPVETRRRNRFKLVGQTARDGDGRDRGLHAGSSAMSRRSASVSSGLPVKSAQASIP